MDGGPVSTHKNVSTRSEELILQLYSWFFFFLEFYISEYSDFTEYSEFSFHLTINSLLIPHLQGHPSIGTEAHHAQCLEGVYDEGKG